ncbi:MAG TPA: hypothetical protein VM864_05355 [Pyrinomonadaceae bacterium]|nr:hypothetical protein [Pyrinomonadaceae bacterium]
MFGIVKKILFWSYGRTSWQYDVLCALILAFIFLTPQGWFATGERMTPASHLNGSKAATKVLLPWSETLPMNPRTDELERRARELTGRSDLRVTGASAVRSTDGKTVAYEVDIQ